MLKKAYKLSAFEINKLKKEKYTNIKGVFFNVCVYKNESKTSFCVIISKKNIKKSHDRNKLKRQIYFTYNNLQENHKKDIKILYINKNTKQEDLKNITFNQIKQEITNICGTN